MKPRVCELCNGEASVYCSSDSAFLCWDCDARVHEANFLVSRHVRRTVCSKCKAFDGNHISGVGFRPVRSICWLCTSVTENDDRGSDSDSSASSACLSSAESFATQASKKIHFDRTRPEKILSLGSVSEVSGDDSCFPAKIPVEDMLKKPKKVVKALNSRTPTTNVDVKAEGILVNWCRKLGLKISSSVPFATHAFGVCRRKLVVLPFRVSLASSLWLSWKLCEGKPGSTCQNLKKLEQISGVPAKLILFAESKLARLLKKMKEETQLDEEEGWAECSN